MPIFFFLFHFTLKVRAAFDLILMASPTAASVLKHAHYLLHNAGHLRMENEVVVRAVAPGPFILRLASSIVLFSFGCTLLLRHRKYRTLMFVA